MKPSTIIVIALSLSAIAAGPVNSVAQQTGFKRTVLQQVDLSVPGREAVTAIAELQPGVSAGRHTHPAKRSASHRRQISSNATGCRR